MAPTTMGTNKPSSKQAFPASKNAQVPALDGKSRRSEALDPAPVPRGAAGGDAIARDDAAVSSSARDGEAHGGAVHDGAARNGVAPGGARKPLKISTVSHTLDADVAERLRHFAFRERISESAVIEFALRELFSSTPHDLELGARLREAGAALRRKS